MRQVTSAADAGAPSMPVMRGLIAAPYTPFDRHSGDVRLDVIEPYAERLVRDGVTGAFVCGTTGEGVSLTLDERMAVAARWVDVAGDSLKVIVHVGDSCQRDAMALAAHAARIGAAGVAAMPAFFFRPAGAQQAIEFCRPIAAAAGAVPFFYYHIPSMSGVHLSIVEMLSMAADRIPNFRGVKFTHPDLMEFQRCLHAYGETFELAWGVDEILVGALAIGAEAAVGSTYNYAAPLYRKMIDARAGGDDATVRECSATVCEMVAVLLKHGGGVRVGKATMEMIGIDCGPPRAPVVELTATEYDAVRSAYEQLGVVAASPRQQRAGHSSNGAPAKS